MHICWVPLCHSLTLWCALAAVYNVHFWLLQGEQTTGSCVWQLKPFSVATEPRLFAGHWAVQNKACISQSPGVSLPGVTHPWLYAFSHATHIHKHIHADLGVAIWPMHSNEFVGHAVFQKKVCVYVIPFFSYSSQMNRIQIGWALLVHVSKGNTPVRVGPQT